MYSLIMSIYSYTDSYRLIVCAALLGMKIREFNDFSRNRGNSGIVVLINVCVLIINLYLLLFVF